MKKLFLSLLICFGFALNSNSCKAMFNSILDQKEPVCYRLDLIDEKINQACLKINFFLGKNDQDLDEFELGLKVSLSQDIEVLKQLLETVKSSNEEMILGRANSIENVIKALESLK